MSERTKRATSNMDQIAFGLITVICSPIFIPVGILWCIGWLFTFFQDLWRRA